MKRVKGCLNCECNEYKKTYYKESDEFCVKCGTKLNYVCKHSKCFKQIPDDVRETYCPVHIAERKDKKEKRVEAAKNVGGGVLAVGGLAFTIGKTAVDIARKK